MMQETLTIDILLATYNGAAYIVQQIHSLQTQTYTQWRLLIHDDGSSDNTLAFVTQMAASDSRIQLIEDKIRLHSASENFMYLLQFSDADFTICCDQDDIWFENKLEVLYDAIRNRNQKIPQAVYGNGYMFYCDTGIVSGRSVLMPPERLQDVLFLNGGIQGCAILFNKKMRQLCLDRPDYVCMHDHLFTLVALTFGEFTYVDRYLMLYRRHAHTVTDAMAGDFHQKTELFLNKKSPVLDEKHYRALRSFYEHYQDRMTKDKRVVFQSFFSIETYNRFRRFWCVLCSDFRLYNKKYILLAKILLRDYFEKQNNK